MKTLILIAQLTTGAIEYQSMPAAICEQAVAELAAGSSVTGVREDGSEVTMVRGACIPDDLISRLEIEAESVGPCDGETS